MDATDFNLEKTLVELMEGNPRVSFAPLSSFDEHNLVLTYTAGPTNVSKRVHRAESSSVVNHLDTRFLKVMDLNQQAIRVLYGREPDDNGSYPMIVAGTGSTAAGAAIYNMLNPSDSAVVVRQGFFGNRLVDFLRSYKIEPFVLDADWGKSADPNKLEEKLQKIHSYGRNVKALLTVLVETSTGVRDPNIRQYSDIYRSIFPDGYVIVDAVSGTGGMPISIDDLGADVIFTGVQKGIGSKLGPAIVLFNERAMAKIEKENDGVVPWNVSVPEHQKYLNQQTGPRPFIYTFPTQSGMALHIALQELFDFPGGLNGLYQTYEAAANLFRHSVGEMGFTNFVEDPTLRAPTIHALRAPDGINIGDYLTRLSQHYGTELNGGLGELKGQIVRIGLLGPVNIERTRVMQLTKNMSNALNDMRQAHR